MISLIQILYSLLFGSLGGGLVIYLVKNYFSQKIKSHFDKELIAVKNDYDLKITRLKGEIDQNSSVLSNVLISQNEGFQFGQNERIESIKCLWQQYLAIKKTIKPIADIDSYLYEHEFSTLFTPEWVGDDSIINSLNKIGSKDFAVIMESAESFEAYRPFLNENLWFLFISYQTFAGRILFLYMTAASRRNISHWKKDVPLRNLVKDNLTSNEFETVLNTNMGSIRSVENFIEQKIIVEISKILSGHYAAENTYNQAIRLSDLINNASKTF